MSTSCLPNSRSTRASNQISRAVLTQGMDICTPHPHVRQAELTSSLAEIFCSLYVPLTPLPHILYRQVPPSLGWQEGVIQEPFSKTGAGGEVSVFFQNLLPRCTSSPLWCEDPRLQLQGLCPPQAALLSATQTVLASISIFVSGFQGSLFLWSH